MTQESAPPVCRLSRALCVKSANNSQVGREVSPLRPTACFTFAQSSQRGSITWFHLCALATEMGLSDWTAASCRGFFIFERIINFCYNHLCKAVFHSK